MKHIREVLAIIWSLGALGIIGYILVMYGQEKEILTLIIGLIGGTVVGGMFGFYFSATHKQQTTETSLTEVITEKTES